MHGGCRVCVGAEERILEQHVAMNDTRPFSLSLQVVPTVHYCSVTFEVECETGLKEVVAVVGDCDELGMLSVLN